MPVSHIHRPLVPSTLPGQCDFIQEPEKSQVLLSPGPLNGQLQLNGVAVAILEPYFSALSIKPQMTSLGQELAILMSITLPQAMCVG